MSRIPKWKTEKTKVKVVFRLQFHATHVPQSGWDKLFVSFIPADTGKTTAKTNKANVRNGNCKWSDPIYETTRLLQDAQSRKYDEKLYKLVVAMGSSRPSILGEVIINLSDFADASKPSSLSLPLIGRDYGTVLHVTVQLLTSKTGFREFEQQRELSVKGFQTFSGQRIHDPAETAGGSLEMERERAYNSRVKLKEDTVDIPSLAEAAESNEDYEDSATGIIDGSSNTSGRVYADKIEISSIQEVSWHKSMTSGDLPALPSGQSPRTVKGDLHGWGPDYYADNDLAIAYEENNQLRVRLEGVESAFLQLKIEANSLQTLTDELGAETQSLANQLVVELASREKLMRDVSILKSECFTFKSELEELKSATAMQCFPGYNDILNHLQVKWFQGLLLLEDKIREIQNKACLGYNGSDFDFMSSDFDVLGSILQKLKQETSIEPVEGTRLKEIQLTRVLQKHSIHGQGLEGSYIEATNVVEEKMYELLQKLEESNPEKGNLTKKMDQMECYYETLIQELEENRHQTVNELGNLRTEHSSCLYTISALQGQIEKLQQDMNEQFIRFAAESCELDSLNKELENRANTSETALKTVRWNYAVAVDRLQKDLELLSYQVLSMYETNENLAKQSLLDGSQLFPQHYPAKGWGDQYKPDIPRIQSESISMKSNFEKSTVANGISDQGKYGAVSSSDIIVENKNIFHRGRLPINVDLLTKEEGSTRMSGLKIGNTESKELKSVQEENNVVFIDLSAEAQRKGIRCEGSTIFEPKYDTQNPIVKPDKQLLGDSIGFEEKRTAPFVQSNHEAEILELHRMNMQLEVYTEVLKETVRSVNDRVMYMKEEMDEVAHQLEHSTADKELLMHKLHNALDEVKILRQDDANYQTKCDDLMLKNHILEAKIDDISGENSSLTQKIAEYEGLVMDYGVYESKYKNCLKERNEFEDMLKNESLQKSCLQNELRSATEDFNTLKEEFETQSSSNFKLLETVNNLQKKLLNLYHNMVSFSEEINGSSVDDPFLEQELASNNFTAIVFHLEKFQQEAYKKILKLCEEKKEIEEERALALCYSNKTESQILHLKQDLEEMRMKLDLSKALTEKLKLEQKDVAEQMKLSLEAEEKYRMANRELLSKLTILEIEIQQANDENKGLAQKLHEFDNGREEHEKTRLNLLDSMQENKALTMHIESTKVESIRLGIELSNIKEDLENAHDNLHSERRLREELEATVGDLKLQLRDKCQQLQSSDEQKLELISLKKRVTDLETETQLLVLHAEESQRQLHSEISSLRLQISDLEYYLAEVLYQSLCADVKVTYMRCQFQLTTEIIEQTKEVGRKFEELHLKHEIVVALLEKHTNAEAQLADENESLSSSLQSVKAELEIVACEKEDLLVKMSETSSLLADVEDMKARAAMVEADNIREKRQYEDEFCQLTNRLVCLEEELDKHTNTETLLADENERLSTTLQSVKAELEILAREKEGFLVKIHETNYVLADVEDMKARAAMVKADNIREKCKYEDEICQLRDRLVSLEEELDKHTNAETQLADENKRLSTGLQSVKAEFEIVASEREGLLVKINDTSSVLADVEDMKVRAAMVEADNIREKRKYEDETCQLRNRLVTLEEELEKHTNAETQLADKNERLSTSLHSVMAELEIVAREKEGLLFEINETNSVLADIDDIKARAAMVKADSIRETCKYEDEICQLKNRLVSLEEELDCILSSKIELETTQIIFKSKIDEQQTTISLLERYEKELEWLKKQHSELTCKLSEQILKTEEFKNLSVHLRELKDKADAECLHVREKRESEGSSLARQDSLRIAFIKEQCESKLQEMRNQLSASKNYAEEMLLKLQNARDEVEAGKRSEASLSKRNEELSMKISNMEAELQTVMSDRKEMAKACDRMKAELECTVLSLECCKEEKLKIEASLQECSEVGTRRKVELDLVKRLLASSTADVKSPKSQSGYHLTTSIGELLEDGNSQSSVHRESPNVEGAFPAGGTVTATVDDPGDNVTKEKPTENPVNSGSFLQALQPNVPAFQDGQVTSPIVKEPLLITSTKHIADIKEHFKEQQRLLTSMDLLHKELEKLKDDNLSSVIPSKENQFDPSLESLQADLCQLDKANEHLRSIFPFFKELPDSGNALEKVLALELELAEALQMKKSTNIHFQSSFLKQHNDNETMFQSFRDINELIKDMLELKKRNTAVETELKEMQSRYSQLSLQFVEVEGEREQLMMTLKSRSPRKS